MAKEALKTYNFNPSKHSRFNPKIFRKLITNELKENEFITAQNLSSLYPKVNDINPFINMLCCNKISLKAFPKVQIFTITKDHQVLNRFQITKPTLLYQSFDSLAETFLHNSIFSEHPIRVDIQMTLPPG